MLRFFEIFAAIVLFVLLFPFFILAVLLVQIDSPGKVIFKQRRVGLNGKEFTLYKLRTIKKDANGSSPAHTQVGDPRFSPLCRFIRTTCIDEVPQLWNIIKGDMSFIGPRPELPKIVEGYTPEQRGVLKYKPGLFGISQIALREGVDYRKKLIIENAYYPKRTLPKDLLITALTPFVILDNSLMKLFALGNGRTEYTDTRWFKMLMNFNGYDPLRDAEKENVAGSPNTEQQRTMHITRRS